MRFKFFRISLICLVIYLLSSSAGLGIPEVGEGTGEGEVTETKSVVKTIKKTEDPEETVKVVKTVKKSNVIKGSPKGSTNNGTSSSKPPETKKVTTTPPQPVDATHVPTFKPNPAAQVQDTSTHLDATTAVPRAAAQEVKSTSTDRDTSTSAPVSAAAHEWKNTYAEQVTGTSGPIAAAQEQNEATTPKDDGSDNGVSKPNLKQNQSQRAEAQEEKKITSEPSLTTLAPNFPPALSKQDDPEVKPTENTIPPNSNPRSHTQPTVERPPTPAENTENVMTTDNENVNKSSAPAQVLLPATSPQPEISKPKKEEAEIGSNDPLEEMQKLGLEKINSYRIMHRVKPLTLSTKLTQGAQAWATKVAAAGHIRHSCLDYGDCDYGENAASEPPHLNFTSAMLNAITAWYNEVNLYDFTRGLPITKGVTGHFTQIVWAGSTEVGLGAARTTTDKYIYIFAQFLPAGNFDGEYIQNVFPPAS